MFTSHLKRRAALAIEWLSDRYPIAQLIEWGRHKEVPMGKTAIWYYFGGVSLFLFIVQLSTGILLMFYYKASADAAFESVQFITSKVPFGWLIRSIHSWSANLMVLAVIIHMFSVFFMGAYRKPRELSWVTGLALLGIVMTFGFSGYLLPWNELSFFATKVGTDMIGVVPYIGKTLMHVLRGGEEVTGSTLTRFFALHVALLPAIFTSVLGIHLLFVQIQGMHEPEDWKRHPENRKSIPFFPHFFLRDVLLWFIILDILAILAVFFPWELGRKADPFASAPAGIKPEWYFLFMFQTLKFLPAKVGPIDGELVGHMIFGGIGVFWLLIPWIDCGKKKSTTKILRGIGMALLLFFIGMTIAGHVLA
ncbi:MAG TPA: cytochrome bc complex cytochrome b subunit [Bdellovibrionota bacterium]|nr:cytochrome bc complex cytochrome b subunit [Bdellovibrionota bacterium]